MNRFIFQNIFGIQGLNVSWYGTFIASGLLLGILLAMQRSKRRGINPDIVIDFLYVALPIAIICARLYYVVFEWNSYSSNILKIFAINEGGLAIYGGIIGGLLSAIMFCWIKKFPLLMLLDLIIPSLILGQAIGRWGNFINQEAYGNIIANPNLHFFPLAVYIENLNEWRQATFFYESSWNFILFCVVLVLSSKKVKDGILLAIYFIAYGIGRFFIEGLRSDSLYIFLNIRVSQIVSFILIIIGIILVLLLKKDIIKDTRYKDIYQMNNTSNY